MVGAAEATAVVVAVAVVVVDVNKDVSLMAVTVEEAGDEVVDVATLPALVRASLGKSSFSGNLNTSGIRISGKSVFPVFWLCSGISVNAVDNSGICDSNPLSAKSSRLSCCTL